MNKQSKAKRLKSFNENWLEDDEFKPWLAKVDGDSSKYKCLTCKKILSLSSSGRGAVTEHKGAASHKLLQARNDVFLKKKSEKRQLKIGESSSTSEKDEIRAIVIWLLKSIESGYSNNSNDDIGDILRSMDPNSKVMQSFKMRKTKASYVVNHALRPYFTGKLYEEISRTDIVVLSFDESMNDVKQENEMVLIIRYWSVNDKLVCTRYLDSAFFGHGRECDLLKEFNILTSKLDKSKVYHISMDGPNVNHSFLRALRRDWSQNLIHQLIDIGTCNLHIVSGAFKTGAEKTNWNIHKTLKGSWQIFHEAPARREDYTKLTSSSDFPMFFSATRWVENEEPATRLIKIWPNITKLWTWWLQQKPASKQPTYLQTKSILNVKAAVEDDLTTTKLSFFCFVASKLQLFLVKYQTDNPMIPFLYEDLTSLVRDLMKIIIKKEVLENALSGKKLLAVNLYAEESLLPIKDIDMGFSTEHKLRQFLQKDKISKSSARNFRKDCQIFVRSLLEKLMERSPISSAFLKHTLIFNPVNMSLLPKEQLLKSFKALLSLLADLSIISLSHGDKALQEFSNFFDENQGQRKFEGYNMKKRLDVFFFHDLDMDRYKHLSFVVRLILTISHGQAACERNFSLKNNLEQVNQETDTIVSRRICKDYLCAKKMKPADIVIDKELMLAVKGANAKYKDFLAEKKKVEEKQKSVTEEEIAVKKKKETLEELSRDINMFQVGVKETERAVNEASCALQQLCQMKRTDKEKLLVINERISKNLKRKADLLVEIELLEKKRKIIEDDGQSKE